jgi:ABC-type Na+ efflux pump permease subunit
MATTALVVWTLTALCGLYMLGVSLGLRRSAEGPAESAPPSFLTFIHPAFALTGAVVWAMFLAYGERPLAWMAFLDLLLVAALGDVLLVSWLKDRRRRRVPQGAGASTADTHGRQPQRGGVQVLERVTVTTVAEQRIPPVVVAAHGGLAAVTLVLVLLCAIGAGS